MESRQRECQEEEDPTMMGEEGGGGLEGEEEDRTEMGGEGWGRRRSGVPPRRRPLLEDRVTSLDLCWMRFRHRFRDRIE